MTIDADDIKLQRDFLYRHGWHVIGSMPAARRPSKEAYALIEVGANETETTGHAVLWYRSGLAPLLEHRALEVAVAVARGKAGPPLAAWPQYTRDTGGRYRYLTITPPTGADEELLDDARWIAP